MDTTPVPVKLRVDDAQTIVHFFDVEGVIELLENACLLFRRWEGDDGGAAGHGQFLHEWLPDALLRVAAREQPRVRGRLNRWWAEKERQAELERVIDRVRGFHIPDAVWIDDWHAADIGDPVLWRMHETLGETIAVTSTVALLRSAFRLNDDQTVMVDALAYGDAGTPSQAATFAHPAYLAPSHLSFERKVRAVLTASDPAGLENIHPAKVDPATLIHAVYVAHATPRRRLELVQKLLVRTGLQVACVPVEFGTRPAGRLPAVVRPS
jgi:hypothetical protein